MSNLKTYFKNVVSVCKKGFAYVKVIPVLIKAVCQRLVGNGYYEVAFTKIGKELFEHTLMVGGASKFLEYYSRGENMIKATIKIANEMDDRHFCGSRLYKNSSTLTGGAFYKDPSGNFNEEIWLCPVTLFLLGKYPERILIYRINKNVLSCPIFFE